MMRRTGVLAVLISGLLAAPAQARVPSPPAGALGANKATQDICGCVIRFANRYVQRASLRNRVARQMDKRRVGPRRRRATKRRVYDWQRDRRMNPRFCRRSRFNKKACDSAVFCLLAAGATLLNETDVPRARRWRHAAVNCAAAAAGVWLVRP